MSNFDYNQLDPGIRELVRFFHDKGYQTCDSGDGVTKLAAGITDGVLDFPHVVIESDPVHLIEHSRNIRNLLQIHFNSLDGVGIEATYSPIDRTCLIFVHGLDDKKAGLV